MITKQSEDPWLDGTSGRAPPFKLGDLCQYRSSPVLGWPIMMVDETPDYSPDVVGVVWFDREKVAHTRFILVALLEHAEP